MHSTKVILVDDLYTVKLCQDNPQTLFVFGDNMIRKGRNGQAVIRDCDNSFGIATKVLPSMSPNSFFSDDNPAHLKRVQTDLEMLLMTKLAGVYKNIAFPSKGLGTGLARLQTKAPNILAEMNAIILRDFGIKL